MKKLLFVALFLSAGILLAQDNSADNHKDSKNQVTVTGCVDRMNGDFVLMKTDPAITYELQGSGKNKLKNYLGHRVEVTGEQEPSLSTSSDTMARTGSASPVTLRVSSIRTLDKNCSEPSVDR